MTLNGIIALILRYFTKFDVTVDERVEYRPTCIMSRKYRLPVTFMGGRRHGHEGALVPLWKCCTVFLCISS